jgi:diaminohydroxyphosphoribosylaminopyrimidine deaminase/5-amino-6-(5-phosphoribosylamino)uracil reductase
MTTDEKYMSRCLELAKLGAGSTAPNPMVGSVIVHNGKIIGEGYHQKHGEPHAEVNAINSVANPKLLPESTIYVTLEPCAHFGLTPPCSDLIVSHRIPRVVIGTIDPFAEVAGRGIEKLERGGVDVTLGVLENECRELNKRFFTFHEKKRPYIILKWAQTVDGFIDIDRTQKEFGEPTWITGDLALRLVHKIRSHESAILVGRKTAEKDNPSLTVRHWSGKNPMRLVLDRKLQLPQSLNLFDQTEKTVVFNSVKNSTDKNIELREIDFNKNIVPQILDELYKLNIQSVIVEGGKQLIESFIDAAIWDEIHLFTGNKFFYSGVKAPKISGKIIAAEVLDSDHLTVFRNS